MKKWVVLLLCFGLVVILFSVAEAATGSLSGVSDASEILGKWYGKFYSEFTGTIEILILEFKENDSGNISGTYIMPNGRKNYSMPEYIVSFESDIYTIRDEYTGAPSLRYGIIDDCMYIDTSVVMLSRSPDALMLDQIEGENKLYLSASIESPIIYNIQSYDSEFLALGRVGDFTKVFMRGADSNLHVGYIQGFPFALAEGYTDYEGYTVDNVPASADMLPLLSEDDAMTKSNSAVVDNASVEPSNEAAQDMSDSSSIESSSTAEFPSVVSTDESVETQIINNGETWMFSVDSETLNVNLRFTPSYGLLSYVVETNRGHVVDQKYRQNLDKRVLMSVPGGGKATMTLHEDTDAPIEIRYDPHHVTVTKSESPVFLPIVLQPGVIYEVYNAYYDSISLFWDSQAGQLSHFEYYGNQLADWELNADTNQNTHLELDGNCRMLLYLNEDNSTPLAMSGPGYAIRVSSSADFSRQICLIAPGEECEYLNICTYQGFNNNGSAELRLGHSNDEYAFFQVYKENGEPLDRGMSSNRSSSAIWVPAQGRAVISLPQTQQSPLVIEYDTRQFQMWRNSVEAGIKRIEEGTLVQEEVLGLFGSYAFASEYIKGFNLSEVMSYAIVNWDKVVQSILSGNFDSRTMADNYMNHPVKSSSLMKTILNNLLDANRYDGVDRANSYLKTTQSMKNYASLCSTILSKERNDIEIPTFVKDYVESLEFISPFLTDYDNHVQVLSLLKRAFAAYPLMEKRVDKLLLDYQTAFIPSMIEEKSLSIITGSITEILDSVIKGFGSDTKLITFFIEDVLGLSSMLEGLDVVISLSPIKFAFIDAFKDAAQNIMNGKRDMDSIHQYVLLFNLCRECLILEYESMVTKYEKNPWSLQLSYLENQLASLRAMTFYKYTPAIPYGDYIAD